MGRCRKPSARRRVRRRQPGADRAAGEPRRSLIYTTALPPPVVAAVDAALDIVEREPERRARLAALSATLRERLRALGFAIPPGEGPIIPVIAGTSERALAWSRGLLERGVFVQAIRPPTVPDGTARLRVTLMATHSDEDLAHAVASLPPWQVAEHRGIA